MSNYSKATDDDLKRIRNEVGQKHSKVRAWMVKEEVKKQLNYDMDESTIRGRFIEMGIPLSSRVEGVKSATVKEVVLTTERQKLEDIAKYHQIQATDILKPFIPRADELMGYIERPIDTKLSVHLNIGPKVKRFKYPLAQGKQGTGEDAEL